MTLAAVTSQVRFAGEAIYSGFFRIVDLDTGETLINEPVPESPWRSVDPNPRGGLRGAKGISVAGDRLIVGNSDTVFVLDRQWKITSSFTHSFMGSIHDVLAEEDAIWITCTNGDLLLKVDWAGTELDRWSWRTNRELTRAFGFKSLPAFEPRTDYRNPIGLQGGVHNAVHLNGIDRCPEGLLLSFGRILSPAEVRRRRAKAVPGRFAARLGITRSLPVKPVPVPTTFLPGSSSAIVLLRDDGGPLEKAAVELLVHVQDVVVPNHNVLAVDDLLLYADSNGSRLVAVERASGRDRAEVTVPGTPAFARGLARLAGDVYLVGSQCPLAVHAVDLARGQVVESYDLGGAGTETVYAVAVVPPTFSRPSGDAPLFDGSRQGVAV
jgi:hypothetical protein